MFVAAVSSISVPSHAHFELVAPDAANEQNDLGEPLTEAPCGTTTAPTGALTQFSAGETIDVTINETIFHPGHYRVALAVESVDELPPDPVVTPNQTTACGTAVIQETPVFPVLADGVLAHTAQFAGPQTFQVTLPDDLSCERCTLQVIEFTAFHGLPCFHYHCAELAVPEPDALAASLAGVAGLAVSARSRSRTRAR